MSSLVASCSPSRPIACATASACPRSMPVASRSRAVASGSNLRLLMACPLRSFECRGPSRASLQSLDRSRRRRLPRRYSCFRTPISTAQTTEGGAPAHGAKVLLHVGVRLRRCPISANGRSLGPLHAPRPPFGASGGATGGAATVPGIRYRSTRSRGIILRKCNGFPHCRRVLPSRSTGTIRIPQFCYPLAPPPWP